MVIMFITSIFPIILGSIEIDIDFIFISLGVHFVRITK